ncbi:uncharacterized protein LOC143770517 isoform X2 [Ranitomeya variabilis]|uniref:uncharacterized protein LOC143770517 isoform X2 n=1 Tax=Ranitomeya variabilis TaxID=490064 RepID=UPI00405672A0
MEEEKRSVPEQESGAEPWVADKETQTEEENNFQDKSTVLVWGYPRDGEEDLRRSVFALLQGNTNGIAAAAPSAMGLDTLLNRMANAGTTSPNLCGQAVLSNPGLGDPDPVGVSRVREPQGLPRNEEDYHFYRLIEEKIQQLPTGKKMTCMLEVLNVVYKHGLAQAESS